MSVSLSVVLSGKSMFIFVLGLRRFRVALVDGHICTDFFDFDFVRERNRS